MSYQLSDNGASIEISNTGRRRLVMKLDIAEISVIRDSIIKIETGNPLEAIYINHSEVTSPSTLNVYALRNQINAWITDCLCCDCDDTPPNEEE